PERRESQRLRPSHLVARCDAVGIGVHPQGELLPDRVRARDHTVVIAAEQWLIVLRESDETVRCRTPREQRRADTEELRAIVDDPVAVAVEREEGLVAA